MKPYIIILAVIVTAAAVLTACGRKSAPEEAEPISFDAAMQRQIAEDSLAFLKTHVSNRASFSEITDVFETLCAEPTADEIILFEAGTFAVEGERLFTMSLARQIPDGEDEYYQIRAELSFQPDADNSAISEALWLDFANGDDFPPCGKALRLPMPKRTARSASSFVSTKRNGSLYVCTIQIKV